MRSRYQIVFLLALGAVPLAPVAFADDAKPMPSAATSGVQKAVGEGTGTAQRVSGTRAVAASGAKSLRVPGTRSAKRANLPGNNNKLAVPNALNPAPHARTVAPLGAEPLAAKPLSTAPKNQ